jgi:hypothetical protein
MKKVIILIVLLILTNCSRIEFDGFDPLTSTARWIITKDK